MGSEPDHVWDAMSVLQSRLSDDGRRHAIPGRIAGVSGSGVGAAGMSAVLVGSHLQFAVTIFDPFLRSAVQRNERSIRTQPRFRISH